MDHLSTHNRAVLAGLLVLTAVLYSPVLSAPFVYEDANWRDATPEWSAPPSRALTTATYALTGDHAPLAHAVNLSLHLVNGALVAAIGAALASPLVGVAAAGVFLLHPLSSEAVAYATGRSDLLLTLGALLALWGVLRSRWAVLGCGIGVALWGKEIGIVVLPLLAVSAWLLRPTLRPAVMLAGCVAGAALLVTGVPSLERLTADPSLPWLDWWAWQNTAVWGLFSKVVWPVGFSIDHDWLTVGAFGRAMAAAALGVALVSVVMCWRYAQPVAWGVAWALLAVAPRYLQRSAEVVAERQVYLALVPVSLGLGYLLARLCVERMTDVSDFQVSPHARA